MGLGLGIGKLGSILFTAKLRDVLTVLPAGRQGYAELNFAPYLAVNAVKKVIGDLKYPHFEVVKC